MFFILKVALLVPVYLNFSKLHLYNNQRAINCTLHWTNAIAVALLINSIIVTTYIRSYMVEWLELLPVLMQGIVLIVSLKRIRAEI